MKKISLLLLFLIILTSCSTVPAQQQESVKEPSYEIIVMQDYKLFDNVIIDYEIVGSGGDLLYYNIEFSTEKYEFVCTQYSFYNINSEPYTGKCDVSIYKVTINDNGTIDKEIIRNYTDNITLSID